MTMQGTTHLIVDLNRDIVEAPTPIPYVYYRTYHALKSIGGSGTAQQVADRSGCPRSNESQKLNTMHLMGILKKERMGNTRQIVFTIIKEATIDFSVPKRMRE